MCKLSFKLLTKRLPTFIADVKEDSYRSNATNLTFGAVAELMKSCIPQSDENPRRKGWKLNVVNGKVEVETFNPMAIHLLFLLHC
jgi:hypothetical protein